MIRWHILQIVLLLTVISPATADEQPAASDPHQQLNQILSQPMYTAWQQRQSGSIPDIDIPHQTLSNWIDRQTSALGRFFRWLFPAHGSHVYHGGSGMGLPAILDVLAWVVGIVAVILIALLLIKISGRFASAAPAPHILSREQVRQAMDSGDALALGSAQWMDEAQRLAAEQNFRAVYRALYLALLSGLHIAGKIEHNRNRTNWTYVQHFRGPAPERSSFSELTDLFDRVWYGRKLAESRNLDELRRTVAALIGGGKP